MQSRGRCRDRSLRLREDGLIVGSIALVGGATDVGRQRHGAALVDRLVEDGPVKGEGERDLAALTLGLDGGIELAEETDFALVPEAYHVARRQPLGGLHESTPARAVEALVQRRLDGRLHCAAADAPAAQPCCNHLGVIDHERIAAAQQVGKIAYATVFQFRRHARTHDQEPRRVPRRNRTRRNAIGREVEIEQRGAHAPSYKRMRVGSSSAAKPREWNQSAAYGRRPTGLDLGLEAVASYRCCPAFPSARRTPTPLSLAGSVVGKISMGIARCGETASSVNWMSPMLLSRLRQMIFTGLAYRMDTTTRAGEANGCRHGEMSGDRTRHPHRSRHRSQELRCHAGLLRTRPLPDLPDRA